MRISDVAFKLQTVISYGRMLEGLKSMALDSPKSQKREMLLDIVNWGLKLNEIFKTELNTIELQEYQKDSMQFEIDRLRLENKKLKIDLEKREKQIKEMV